MRLHPYVWATLLSLAMWVPIIWAARKAVLWALPE